MTTNAINYINNMKHGVVPIIGSGKTFKSGTLYSLLEICDKLKSRPTAFYKFPNVKEIFPYADAYTVDDLDDVEPDSVLVIEDANRVLPSRSSSHAASLQEWMGVISHKDILILLTIQNTANTDLALFRDQDIVRLYKTMSPDAILYERPEWRTDAERANREIKKKVQDGYNRYYLSFVPVFDCCIHLQPPAWYGEKQSHALRNYRVHKKEAE